MPGFSNSLIVSLLLHALVAIPVASVILSGKDTLPTSSKPLQLTVISSTASPQVIQEQASKDKQPVQKQSTQETQAREVSRTPEPQVVEVSKPIEQPKPTPTPKKRIEQKTRPETVAKASLPEIPEKPTEEPHEEKHLASLAEPTVAAPQAIPPAEVTEPQPSFDESLLDDYRNKLLASIIAAKRYPLRARRKGLEGETTVTFSVLKDGRIVDIKVQQQSGHRILDKAALEALERVGHLDPIPPTIARERWDFSIPIRFQLL